MNPRIHDVQNAIFRERTMRARIAKTVIVALLAAGSAAVVSVAAASASEDTGTAISASIASGQRGNPAPALTELPRSALAPEPGRTTPRPPTPDPSRTTTPPPTPDPSRTTTRPPTPGKPPKGYNGTARWFSPGGVAGACGQMIRDSDFVVALDPTMFGGGNPPHNCGREIIVTYKGKSIIATVLDASPDAERYGIDLTRSAFKALAPLDQETINVTWRFAK
ncbi:RlpA-like double-psi beta-barrel domain-containing protein [Kitasatospora sp. NPDC001175]